MSGIVNSTGAVSGIIGTTVGTPVGAAGSIIQTTTTVGHPTDNTSVSSPVNGSWAATVITGSITPLYSDSSIIIHAKFTIRADDTSGDCGYGYRFWRSATGITDSYIDSISGYDTSGSVHSQMYRNAHQYTTIIGEHDLSWQDNNVTIADTAVTYTLYVSTYEVSNLLTIGSDYNARWDMFFQEVKR